MRAFFVFAWVLCKNRANVKSRQKGAASGFIINWNVSKRNTLMCDALLDEVCLLKNENVSKRNTLLLKWSDVFIG